LNGQIFWYKSESRADFKLGSKELYEVSIGIDLYDKDEVYDQSKSKKKTTGQQITVKNGKW
jgi:hypothetical protein